MDSRGDVFVSLGKLFVKVIIPILFVLLFLSGVAGTVQTGDVGVKTRLGQVVGTVGTGLYFKAPFIEKVNKIDVRTRVIKNEHYVNESGQVVSDNALQGASKDLQDVSVSIVVNYRLDPTKAVDIFTQYKSVETFEEGVIKPLIKQIVKATTAQYTAEELVTKRTEYNSKTAEALRAGLSGKNVILEENNITNIGFSDSFTKSIERKVTAEQDALTSKNKLEQTKYEGEQKIVSAKAEAEAIRIQSQAINSQGGADYVELQKINKWNGAGCTSYCGDGVIRNLLLTK